MSTTFFLFLSMNTPPAESTAAAIPAFPLNINSHSLPVPHAAREFCSLTPETALLVLLELPTPDSFWRATGEATLEFGRGEGGPSERWEGGSTKVANVALAFAFPSGSTLGARSETHYTYGGILEDHPASALLFYQDDFVFFFYNVKGKQVESEVRYKRNVIEDDRVVGPAVEHKIPSFR